MMQCYSLERIEDKVKKRRLYVHQSIHSSVSVQHVYTTLYRQGDEKLHTGSFQYQFLNSERINGKTTTTAL